MVKIKQSTEKIKADIIEIIRAEAKARIRKNRPRIRKLIKYEIFKAVFECPEMESARNGTLKYDFGLDSDPTFIIAEAASNAFTTRYTIDPSNIFLFTINIQPTSYMNLLSLPEAFQITEKGESLPWLEWLMIYGSFVVAIDGYGVKYTSGGRSGGAVMIKGYNYGEPFMVNPRYSGTVFDNFITRALDKHTQDIIDSVWEIVRI